MPMKNAMNRMSISIGLFSEIKVSFFHLIFDLLHICDVNCFVQSCLDYDTHVIRKSFGSITTKAELLSAQPRVLCFPFTHILSHNNYFPIN